MSVIIEQAEQFPFLLAALHLAWGADTVRDGDDWTPLCPSLNQCCPTALVVQAIVGGRIRRCKMQQGGTHFYNILCSGTRFDATGAQFEYTRNLPQLLGSRAVGPKSLLRVKHVAHRYELLLERTQHWLTVLGSATKLSPQGI